MQRNSDPVRMRARRLPAEERRRQILDAAIAVFARQGYAGTGTADIARAAGIGEPTIYRYFPNKRELYVAAIREGADEIREEWEHIAETAPDPMTALQQIGIWYYAQMHKRPELLQLRSRSFLESGDTEVAEVVREQYRSIVRFVESLFQRARAAGQVSESVEPRTMTWLFMAVGALLDLTQMLDLGDELKPSDVVHLAALLQTVKQG
jgi:AcrR family transcriptional regulator